MKTLEQQYFWTEQIIKCASGEIVKGYYEYIKTKHWRDLRVAIFRRDKHKCQKCGRLLSLEEANVHHKTYVHIGNEKLSDLVLLCQECHKKEHGLKSGKNSKDWRKSSWRKK